MTAIVTLNIMFAASVLMGMLTLLGRAIVADCRATGAGFGLDREILAVRPQFKTPSVRRSRRPNPAV